MSGRLMVRVRKKGVFQRLLKTEYQDKTHYEKIVLASEPTNAQKLLYIMHLESYLNQKLPIDLC